MKILKGLFKIIIRLGFGTFGIYILNTILSLTGFSVSVGINLYTIGLLAVMGLPALIICYGMLTI